MIVLLINEMMQMFGKEKENLVPVKVKGNRNYRFDAIDDFFADDLKEILQRYEDKKWTFVFWGEPSLPQFISQACTDLELELEGILPLDMIVPTIGCSDIKLDPSYQIVIQREGRTENLGLFSDWWMKRHMKSKDQQQQDFAVQAQQLNEKEKQIKVLQQQITQAIQMESALRGEITKLQSELTTKTSKAEISSQKLQEIRERFFLPQFLEKDFRCMRTVIVSLTNYSPQENAYPIWLGETMIGSDESCDIVIAGLEQFHLKVVCKEDGSLFVENLTKNTMHWSRWNTNKNYKEYELSEINSDTYVIENPYSTEFCKKIVIGGSITGRKKSTGGHYFYFGIGRRTLPLNMLQ